MHIVKLITLTMFLVSIGASNIAFAEPDFECYGFSTVIYKNNDLAIAVCHSQHMKVKRSLLKQWQGCSDAMIYIRNKKINKSELHTDCSPITYKEFKVIDNHLLIKHYHTEYPGFEIKPLLVENHNLIKNTKTHTLVVKLPTYTKKEIQLAIYNISKIVSKPFDGNTYFDAVYGGFFMLRGYTQTDPKFALKKLREYNNSDLFSGEVSEVLSDVVDEAELISLAVKNK